MELDRALDLLGVSPDCTQGEVKQAFRILALAYHPDRYRGKDANERIRELNEAYQESLSYARSNPNAGRFRAEQEPQPPPQAEPSGQDGGASESPPPRGGGVSPEEEKFRRYMDKYQTQRGLGNHNQALKAIDRALSFRPNDAGLYRQRFELLCDYVQTSRRKDVKSDRFLKAIETANRLLEMLPGGDRTRRADVMNRIGLLHSTMGDEHGALDYFTRAIDEGGEDPGLLYNHAITLHIVGKDEQAHVAFDRYVERYSHKALSNLENLCRRESGDAFYAYHHARSKYATGQMSAAIAEYERLSELDAKAALAYIDRDLQGASENPFFWYRRAYALWKVGRFADAMAAYRRIAELNSRDPQCWYFQAILLSQEFPERLDEIEGCLRRTVRIDPSFAETARRDSQLFSTVWERNELDAMLTRIVYLPAL